MVLLADVHHTPMANLSPRPMNNHLTPPTEWILFGTNLNPDSVLWSFLMKQDNQFWVNSRASESAFALRPIVSFQEKTEATVHHSEGGVLAYTDTSLLFRNPVRL